MTIRVMGSGSILGKLNSSGGSSMPNWDSAIEQKIQSSDSEAGDTFGFSVAISRDGNTAIVGADKEDTSGGNAGSAYIFVRGEDSLWVEHQKIQSSDKHWGDYFGHAVAIDSEGTTIVVGARYENAGGDQSGAAYIFTRSGETWTQSQKIQSSDLEAYDRFGHSVSISGDGSIVFVGADKDKLESTSTGSVYVFTSDSGVWSEQQKLRPLSISVGDYFGHSLAISRDGSTAIVGAIYEDSNGSNAGAAYIFTNDGSTWIEQDTIIAGDGQLGDEFGYSVAISNTGQTVIIGARQEDTGGSGAGSAYIFTRSGETWSQQQRIQSSDKSTGSLFGHSASVSGDGKTVVIGAQEAGGDQSGAAYIFTRGVDNVWVEEKKLLSSDIEAGDRFGYVVAIDSAGTTAIVGAYVEDTNGTDAGAAYIYQV